MHDLSPHGMKIETEGRLPFSTGGTLVDISFWLNAAPFTLRGSLSGKDRLSTPTIMASASMSPNKKKRT
ncbi:MULTISPECIES: hypothetical protein [Geobacillus thermoleovorans group]|uniref:hypothetical protein n=1 Tax=Geobacillus thermoleovorans group TaxID=1505648 RepID=UPI001F0D4D77|nr:hypothetical protein [Geobacillus kaustophilus]MED4971930.1 hypothetical protein [Geobacillus thermoleovorans]